ncbi:MAG: hypothetical protein SGI73_05520 [Chloroflexota bacterium]|nr:hypothetical protein [Chloroflexota bacterium]
MGATPVLANIQIGTFLALFLDEPFREIPLRREGDTDIDAPAYPDQQFCDQRLGVEQMAGQAQIVERIIGEMDGHADVAQREVQRQSGEYVEAAARARDQDGFCAVQRVEDGEIQRHDVVSRRSASIRNIGQDD